MKLRFRQNTIRLRLNRHEVQQLAQGQKLRESVQFPGASELAYTLESASNSQAAYSDGLICISAPQPDVKAWAESDGIGLYLDFPADRETLKVAIEKDLECLDGPEEERDPHAFSREQNNAC